MKVAAIQMVSGTQVLGNLQRAQGLLEEAASQGAELAVLPEYFCLLGRRDTDKLAAQEPFGHGPIQQFLADTASRLKLWIVGGTMPISTEAAESVEASTTGERVLNTSLAFSPSGECVARYDKIHLFKFDNGRERYDESRILRAGVKPATFQLTSRDGHTWTVGMSVCYDMRFPELYRLYAAQGADLLLMPSAFTHTTGQAHWELLLRARAVENLAFVAAPAQGGLHENGRTTWGHSMLVDPWGHVLQQTPEGESVVLADLDIAALHTARTQLPALRHRVF